VIQEIKQILCDPGKGLSYLLSDGTPILVLEGVIKKIVQSPATASRYDRYHVCQMLENIEDCRAKSAAYAAEAMAIEENLFAL
jgi:hypothetical protein